MLYLTPCKGFYLSSALLMYLLSSNALGGATTRVNVSSSGQPSNPVSSDFHTSLSADGRYVAFASRASNLVPNDNNDADDMFVHDRLTHKTERISVTSDGKQGNKQTINGPSISADGRYVAFLSEATNLVVNDNNNWPDAFVYDRLTKKTTRVSVTSDGKEMHGVWFYDTGVGLSADGRYVAFTGVNGSRPDGTTCSNCDGIFVHDRLTHKTEQIITGYYKGVNANSISTDGRYIAFTSTVPGGAHENKYLSVYDRQTKKIEPVNIAPNGKKISHITWDGYSLSTNGRYIVFASSDAKFVVGGDNNSEDIFLYDRTKHKTERVTTNSYKQVGCCFQSIAGPSISADGRYVAFQSFSPDLIPGDVNGSADTFIYDRLKHKTELVSVNTQGLPGKNDDWHGLSAGTSISADGRYVGFASFANDLVNNDSLYSADVFVRDRLLDSHHHADLAISLLKGDYLYAITNHGPDKVHDITVVQRIIAGRNQSAIRPLEQGSCSSAAMVVICHLGKLAPGKRLLIDAGTNFSRSIFVNSAPLDTVPTNNQMTFLHP